jgi:glucose-1-phosphate thymidylyltransferase
VARRAPEVGQTGDICPFGAIARVHWALKGLVLIDPPCDCARRPSWSTRPAALAPVANRTVLAHAIDTLAGAGAREVAVVCTAAVAPRLRRATEGQAGAEPQWITTADPGDAAEALLAAERFIGSERFAVHTTGGLWLRDRRRLGELLRGSEDDALLFLAGVPDRERGPQPVAQVGGHRPQLPTRPGAEPELGISCFSPALLETLRGLDAPERSLSAALEALAGEGAGVAWAVADGWCPFAGSAADLLALNRIALDELIGPEAEPGAPEPADSRLEGRVALHPSARVSRAVIRGPALIGAGARVADSYIGPHTVLGEATVVENAEIESSVLLTGARVQNAGVRIESSVIGRRAWVGRTFELPRALRLVVGDDAGVELS